MDKTAISFPLYNFHCRNPDDFPQIYWYFFFYHVTYSHCMIFFFLKKYLFFFFLKGNAIYLFILAVLGLRFCARAFSSCGERGPLFIAVRGPLTVAASLAAEHRLQTRRLSSCGSRT